MITQQSNYSNIAAAQHKNTTAGNRNISSVLSQIQDEGPAYTDVHTDSQQRDKLINFRSDTSNRASGGRQSDMLSNDLNNDEKQPDLSAKLMQTRMKNRDRDATTTGLNKNNASWIQLTLILFVALAIMLFLFRLDARTNQFEAALNSHDDEVLDSIYSYSSELSPGFRSIKKTLKEVKQELELIKTNTVSEMKSASPVASKSFVNEQSHKTAINDNIGIMDDEMLALKNELKIAKEKLKAISVAKKAIVTTTIAATGWVVNLASFTNKNKADKALQPLYAAGLSPLIQEANVNGQRLYRLIIDGFASQAAAKLFVRRADDQFGLQGGWVRKS